ncbi:uncharacterized protein GGS25DRAFT_504560 [Hypoxylon fragiforme]|uniref:uncharacterized protein n=1 Tax=Hypoxylon fragiforme TaxID=63214 RepID=UPI0020C6A2F3|nr:uncharacterized protein GGS25DRAFT_504560 [Hypoxylon fragiforme]KAI2605302.1 hypothetical protein GGS25DRAFT_504560 [Hypoxylon fragiforme]
MYGIIAFNKGEKSPSTEFRAELGRYGRGLACKECRISRVRCSGKLDGKNCDRCKRLAKPCLYTNNQNQRHTRANSSVDVGGRKSRTSTRAPSPEQASLENSSSESSAPSPPDQKSSDESQFVTDEFVADDNLGLDFDGWLQLQNSPTITEALGSHIDVVATSPHTELPEPLYLPPLQVEGLGDDEKMCDGSEGRSPKSRDSGIGEDSVMGHDLPTSISMPDLHAMQDMQDMQDLMPDTWGSGWGTPSQCKCLQAMTSSISILRSWTWGGECVLGSGTRPDGLSFNCVKVEDFLAVFEKSMTHLIMAENCPLACTLSHDLAVLLLLVVEQLSKMLLSIAADLAGGGGSSKPSHLTMSAVSTPCFIGNKMAANLASQQGQDTRFARIGTFEIMDPLDQQMIMKLLLQIRTQALDAYVRRWSDKVRNYGLHDLEVDLKKIRADLSRVVFLDNVGESSTVSQAAQLAHSIQTPR